ncbi:MAG: NAD(P)/FAD-dependent oxidoreductase, partial [Alphaproteobacteria bacterium]|nr:NAD(P)/FAD-dependent oxidoreductase [Alphaproteobacteria bacterium]
MTRQTFDVVVLGAGAAGLMCAIRAGQRGRRVLVLEHADKPGKKILISGGGRCNFTNLEARPEAFLSANPHFAKSALARYTQHDFIALVDKHRIAWHEKTLGQLFCDGSARQIVAMLLAECAAVGAEVRVAHRVTAVEKAERFTVHTDKGDFDAASVVLATGGLSIPKMGASGFAHDVARRFGLAMTQTRPALVPLTLKVPDIAGVSLEVVARFGKTRFREAMLFTHRGLSGPAILQISSYWKPGQEIAIDLLPDLDAAQFLKERRHARPKAELRTLLAEVMPQRLANVLADGDLAKLNDWRIVPTGTEGYAKAEVTLGGVDTAGLSSQTMGARNVPG